MLTFFFFNYLSLLASIYVPNIPFLIRVYRSCIIPFKEKEIRVKNRCIEYDLISKKTSLYIFQVALHLSHAPITLCRETSMSVLPVSGVADKAQSERREEETTRCIFSQPCWEYCSTQEDRQTFSNFLPKAGGFPENERGWKKGELKYLFLAEAR